MLHASSISFSRCSHLNSILWGVLSHEVPHCAVYSSGLLPFVSDAQISTSVPYSQTPSAYVSPSMWKTIFDTCIYKTTGKVIVSTFIFLVTRLAERRLWTEWQQAFPQFSLLLMSSWKKKIDFCTLPKIKRIYWLSSLVICITFTRHESILSLSCGDIVSKNYSVLWGGGGVESK
jgi:hypothetical protein